MKKMAAKDREIPEVPIILVSAQRGEDVFWSSFEREKCNLAQNGENGWVRCIDNMYISFLDIFGIVGLRSRAQRW